MTEFEETSKKIQDLVDEVFKQGIGVGYDHGLEVGTHNGYKRGYENGKNGYKRGLDDAIDMVKWLFRNVPNKRLFDGNYVEDILNLYSWEQIIAGREAYEQDKPKQDKDYHEEAWWQNLGYDIEQMADDWGCTIECIAERANQLWEEKGELND